MVMSGDTNVRTLCGGCAKQNTKRNLVSTSGVIQPLHTEGVGGFTSMMDILHVFSLVVKDKLDKE